MKFEDRITFASASSYRRKWQRYWAHLAAHGFTAADPVYRHFAGEVFHDGEVTLRHFDLASGSLVVRLRNVHAIDEITRSDAFKRAGLQIDKRDFETDVTFSGVMSFRLRHAPSRKTPLYHAAQLERSGNQTTLTVAFVDEAGQGGGRMSIAFASADVEDIAPKILKYLDHEAASRFITAVDKDPAHYAAHLAAADVPAGLNRVS
jgi:hypothetical protein